MDAKIKVMVIDGSVIHTQLLSDALRRDKDLEVFSYPSVQGGIGPALERAFDVLIVSANLNEQSYRGLDFLREARLSRPELRAVVLLDSSKPESVLEVFRAGAKGVFSRQESLDKLCKCIRCVHSGQIWADSREVTLALEALASAPTLHAVDANGLNLLSKREGEIVECVAEGLTNREIAERLRLSRHTIKNSLFRIFDKLGVSNRLELLLMTLSRDSKPQSVFTNFLKTGIRQDDICLEECRQAAEQGSAIAQLLLAQMFSTSKGISKHTVLAYKWYLIAGARLSQETKNLTKVMSKDQLSQSQEMASRWLKTSTKIPSASVDAVSSEAHTARMEAGD